MWKEGAARAGHRTPSARTHAGNLCLFLGLEGCCIVYSRNVNRSSHISRSVRTRETGAAGLSS